MQTENAETDARIEEIRAAVRQVDASVKHMDCTYEVEQRKTRNTLIAAIVVALAAARAHRETWDGDLGTPALTPCR